MIDIGITELGKSDLDKLFRNECTYIIPHFQREYSWTKDDWTDLWDDISKTIPPNGHFFGFITLKKNKPTELSIIEGQQRFTTVSILLSVIRDIYYTFDKGYSESLHTKYLVTEDILSRENPPVKKLVLSECNKSFFENIAYDNNIPNLKISKYSKIHISLSNSLILNCYKYFYDNINNIIKSKVNKDKDTYLQDILNKILKHFIVITTEVTDNKVAFNFFQTLNDRGIDLTTSDLIKMHLLIKADESWSEAKSKWDEIKNILSNINTNTFFRHFWLSYYGVVKENEILDEVEKRISNKKDVFRFLNILRENAEIYCALLEPSSDYWENKEVIKHLDEIQTLSTQMTLPFLMACSKLEIKEFIKSMIACISFTFRYVTIGEREKKNFERLLSEIAIDIRNNKIKSSKDIVTVFKRECPDDDTFVNMFSKKSIKTTYIARYILLKIEDSLSCHRESYSKKLTLEHILPNTLNAEWISYLKSHNIEKDDLVNRIGNLTLLLGKVNKDAQNKFFKEKRDTFYKNMTSLKINDSLKTIKSWTDKDISSRQLKLAHLAKDIWTI